MTVVMVGLSHGGDDNVDHKMIIYYDFMMMMLMINVIVIIVTIITNGICLDS